MTRSTPTRRRFLQGTAAAAGIATLAGCSGDGGDGGGGGDDVPSAIEDHLADANEYDGSLQDATGQSEVTVEVGAGPNGFAFDPAGLRIDAGTTVVWEWTGVGGRHNVNSVDGSDASFSSGDPVDSSSETFEYTFESAGNMLYECTPHAATGMLGGIEVVE